VRFSQQLSISLLTPPSSDAEPTCRLFHNGRDTSLILPGATLEAAIELPHGWLVFLTHDIPYEEGLEICLVSSTFELLDRATLAAPYSTGAFENLEITSPTSLCFDFLGERPWQLDLLENPRFRLPVFTEPLGVQRPFGFKRHFLLNHRVLT